MRTVIATQQRTYPAQGVLYHHETTLSVVLVQDSHEQATAYAGLGTPEWTLRYGVALPLAEAQRFWPALAGRLADLGLIYGT